MRWSSKVARSMFAPAPARPAPKKSSFSREAPWQREFRGRRATRMRRPEPFRSREWSSSAVSAGRRSRSEPGPEGLSRPSARIVIRRPSSSLGRRRLRNRASSIDGRALPKARAGVDRAASAGRRSDSRRTTPGCWSVSVSRVGTGSHYPRVREEGAGTLAAEGTTAGNRGAIRPGPVGASDGPTALGRETIGTTSDRGSGADARTERTRRRGGVLSDRGPVQIPQPPTLAP